MYGQVIENLEQNTVSGIIKNKDLSGDPSAGSVEAKRFENVTSNPYKTARTGGKGTQVTAKPVTVQIDTDREIIEEVEEKDVKLYGVQGFISRRVSNHERTMKRELERAFFSEGKTSGTSVTFTAKTPLEMFEEIVQKITTLKNDYIDGVERDMISVTLTEGEYGKLRTYMDTSVQNSNVDSSVKEIGTIHGVKVFSCVYLPTDVTHMAMVDGAIAQPVMTTLDETGKFPASNAYHFGIFYSYGTKAVMEDTIFYANANTPS